MATAETKRLSSSLEDYLEAVFEIVREKRAARAKDIAERMDVGRSSVTGALKALAERNLVNYAPYDLITLTETGENVAQQIARRHEVLKDFLVTVLSIEEDEANETACKMEHVVSENVLDRFIAFAEFVERCPRGGAQWVENFGYYCNHEQRKGDCGKCVSQVLDEVREKRVDRQQEKNYFSTLDLIKVGSKAVIKKVNGKGGIRRRLLDMGAINGTVVEVERIAPFGDPIEIKLKGYHLTLRKEEAEKIVVETI